MPPRFVHLRVHTEFSLVDGLVRVKPLMRAVAAGDMPAVALTDQSNLFAMVKFYRAALAAGIKPIIGVEVRVAPREEREPPSALVLLCQNKSGYRNLSQLVTRSYIEGQHRGVPMIERAWLQEHAEGLIALSGGRCGDIGQALLAGDTQRAETAIEFWSRLFPDRFYLEVQRSGRDGDERYLHEAVKVALRHDLPVVATNDVRFLRREDFAAHEARVCINDGRTLDDSRRPRNYSEEQYLRSADEMQELFSDLPEALENSVEIAKRCNLQLTLGENYLPNFPVPEGMTIASLLERESRKGLDRRLESLLDKQAPDYAERRRAYEERLATELEVIIQMDFPGYFLIVADFIQWAKDNGEPVGPGRGSGAGSLVAYALLITDLDPLQYDLLFERFLNPERVSMPDFDVDFCMEGRDRVIDYVAQRYGRDHVSQIITYGTMAAKAVVRDAGRVLGHPYGFVDQIAKLIPFEIGMTLDKAMEQEEELARRYDQDEDVHTLLDLAKSLEGITRNAGKHAGGVVIGPTPLTEFMPLYCEQGGEGVVSQFDKDDVEAIGLVKFDFLGLRTLTIIDWALKTVNRTREARGESAIDITTIPLDDVAAFKLLKDCQTTAVFQLESRGMKDLIKRLQPDCFEDIIALVALFRPGPLQSGMVDDFINRKHGRAKVEYPHQALEPILQPTYGVILYQEQVMQIAQVLASYTLGGADLLRRAMGKKKPEEMAKQGEIFRTGAVKNGVDEKTASYIFDLMEKFAGYGFNKSHSAAYALVSYQTAWLKAHYPAPFMAAVLSSDMDNTDKVVMLIDECRGMGLEVAPPDVNRCEHQFAAVEDKLILYGLGAIKGVGEAAIQGIIEERREHGAYKDLFDFCRRIDLRKANRRVLEALIRGGALDGLGPNRASMMASLTLALQGAEQHSRNQDAGILDLFGGAELEDNLGVDFQLVEEWEDETRLRGEKETLGLYLTGHPIDRYLDDLRCFVAGRLVDLQPSRDQTEIVVAGLVVALQTRNTKSGDRIAFLTLDDKSGRLEVAAFTEAYKSYQDLIAKDQLLVIRGVLGEDDYSGGARLRAREIYGIDQAREYFARRLVIGLDAAEAGNGFIERLREALAPFREGHCPVVVDYRNREASASIPMGEAWRVRPTDELLHRLKKLTGEQHVRVIY